MDRFELYVRQGRLDQDRQPVPFGVEEALQVGHAVGDGCVRRWHEYRVAWARAANPVLAATELARLLLAASTAGEELPVNLADQPRAEWEAAAEALKAVLHRGHVAGHLDDVVEGHTGRLLHLKQQQVGE